MKYSYNLIFAFFDLVKSACYMPNGVELTSKYHPGDAATDYVPCNPDPNSFSMCCATNRTQGADVCLPSGLCATNGKISPYYRESCSDPSWKSPFCLRDVCTNPTTGGNFTSDSGMAQCWEDGSWCCGFPLTSQSCCNMKNEKRFFLASTAGLGGSNVLGTLGMQSSTSTLPKESATMAAETPSSRVSISTVTASISSSISSSSNPAADSPSSTLSPSSTMSSATSSNTTNTFTSPQTSTIISTASAPISEDHMSTTPLSTSPTPTSSPEPKPRIDIKAQIGISISLGVTIISLASLLIYTWRRKRRPKAPLEVEAKPAGDDLSSNWSDSSFVKPELDSREEIHMIGHNDNQWRVGRAELSEVRAERFELEASMRRNMAGIGR